MSQNKGCRMSSPSFDGISSFSSSYYKLNHSDWALTSVCELHYLSFSFSLVVCSAFLKLSVLKLINLMKVGILYHDLIQCLQQGFLGEAGSLGSQQSVGPL